MKARLTAQVLQVYKAPEGKTKAGEVYGGDWRVTLLAPQVLQDGQEVLQPHEVRLGTEDAPVAPWRASQGKRVAFDADFYSGKSGLGFRVASVPEVVA